MELTNCTSLVTNKAPKGDERSWYWRHGWPKTILEKMSDTSTKISVPQWCGIILFNMLDILGEYLSNR